MRHFVALVLALTPVFGARHVDLSRFEAISGFNARQTGDTLTIDWTGENAQPLRLALNLADATQLISEVAIGGKTVLKNAAPAYWVYVGRRHGTWEDSYFDNPSTRPHEISEHFSKLTVTGARVETDGSRLRVIVPELWLGYFHGDLAFTMYAGSNLVKLEAVVSTQEPNIAYYYDAWLTRCSTNELNRLYWLDADDKWQQHRLMSDIDLEGPHLKVHRRTLVAEGPNGSLAVFPPPHQYFFARDETINYGNLWYRLYSINPRPELGDFFSFGIRQTPYSEEANKAPLVNAPRGSEQRMAMFWYIGAGRARETFDKVSGYTHNDTFPAISGRKTFTSHYHLAAVMDWLRRDKEHYTPEWATMFKNMGVSIAHLEDYHTDGHARDLGSVRLNELQDYFELTRMLSGPDFLVLPGEELWEYFGGHWSILLPKPTSYFLRRNNRQPFVDNVGPAGTAYRIGSPQDMLEMIHREGGVAWQAHPRTKGSAGFPDTNKEQFFFKDPSWLGGAFKAMPSDYSSPRLGERALNLLDDMNNWGYRKFLIGEVDVFKINHTHELYAHMNINYLKLDTVPSHPDWQPVVAALQNGSSFVTTGEVLLDDWQISRTGEQVSAQADVQWSFPLNFCELVWGDGAKTHRKLLPLAGTRQYGREKFRIAENAPGAKWARFAVWDVAANGAFTQPVRFDGVH
jgi:hypothetical protein